MKGKLNTRQERFCDFIAAGDSQTDAYLKAGFKVPKADARKHAARLMTNDDIKARIAALRAPQTRKALLTRDRKRELLAWIAEDPTASLDARIRAMAEDSKMAGHYEPERVEVDPGRATLQSIKERVQHVVRALSIAYQVKTNTNSPVGHSTGEPIATASGTDQPPASVGAWQRESGA